MTCGKIQRLSITYKSCLYAIILQTFPSSYLFGTSWEINVISEPFSGRSNLGKSSIMSFFAAIVWNQLFGCCTTAMMPDRKNGCKQREEESIRGGEKERKDVAS